MEGNNYSGIGLSLLLASTRIGFLIVPQEPESDHTLIVYLKKSICFHSMADSKAEAVILCSLGLVDDAHATDFESFAGKSSGLFSFRDSLGGSTHLMEFIMVARDQFLQTAKSLNVV
eukprot:scaffold7641_cov115-Cylindrotheca_fusiformis.AAC.20